jgi:hypothetical protein
LSFTDMSSPISLMPSTVRGEGVRGGDGRGGGVDVRYRTD